MPRNNIHYYVMKTARISGWLLLPLVVLYLVTGFALCGEFGVNRWITPEFALEVHRVFEWPLIAIFLAHTSTTAYFAMRRWGWIKTRKCP